MKLETDEKIIKEGGIVLYFKGPIMHKRTDKIYLTNKRVFTKCWIPVLNFFSKGISFFLKDMISVKKARWVLDDALTFRYKKDGIEKQIKIAFSKKKNRDEFYNELRKLIPSKSSN
jgi:hypothetical protein